MLNTRAKAVQEGTELGHAVAAATHHTTTTCVTSSTAKVKVSAGLCSLRGR